MLACQSGGIQESRRPIPVMAETAIHDLLLVYHGHPSAKIENL
jgi:hypothetical protein